MWRRLVDLARRRTLDLELETELAHHFDALVRLKWAGKNDMVTDSSDYGFSGKDDVLIVRSTFSYPMFQQFVAQNRTLDDLFACAPFFGRANVVVDGRADIANAFVSTGNYY